MQKKRIFLPELTVLNAVNFCNAVNDFNGSDSVVFDYSGIGTVEPFGMLLVGSKIRSLITANPNIKFFGENYKNHNYAAHMGFFQSMFLNFGNKPGGAFGSNTYVPITELKVRDLKNESYEQNEVVQETIERKSYELAKVLSQGNPNLTEILGYSIRELMRNSVEHSTAESCWFAAQYWPTKNKVEIALLDEGVGIPQAIRVNPNLKPKDNKDALLLSLEPGISGKVFKHNGVIRGQNNSVWDNSGYGLFVTSKICQDGGDLFICSGNIGLALKNEDHAYGEVNFQGTAIRMTLNTSNLGKFNGDLIKEIVKEGESRAKSNSKHSIITASKVSRILNTAHEE
ncbi:hypothetical protein ACSBQ0_18505 [Bacillus altitudinis]|uniref:hypothetical protein n=1 Tax=Bacillus TaxID=1386 RepID=UPI00192BA7C9|nr:MULTISPECIES: hypothetical protein [Bacillus]QQX15217.1 hypothetical protein JKL50_03620 [Bacillus altitudinis]